MGRFSTLPFRAACAVAAPLLLGAGQATAQNATPVAPSGSPTAAECAAEPRPLADFEALIGAPVPPTPATFEPPAGEPAEPDVAAAVTETMAGAIACFNTTDFPRFGGYYTDEGFREDFVEDAAEFVEITRAGLRLPPEFRIALVGVRDVVVLDDGRVGAVVAYDTSQGIVIDYVLFVVEDGRYLIDFFVDEYDGDGTGTPVAATPVA